MVRSAVFMACFILLIPLVDAEGAPGRKALIIGNANYASLKPIPGAQAGGHALAAALKDVGFIVIDKYDLSLTGLKEVIEKQFIPSLQAGEVCLIYYSGYGIQSQGSNYLVPVDFDPNIKGEAYGAAYSIGRLLSLLDKLQLSLKLLLVEAGWDEGELAAWAGTPGLASPGGSQAGTVLVFDTKAGASTSDTVDGMGLFTAAFLHALPTPGITLTDIISKVQTQVAAKSQGRQQPYPVGGADFYFIGPIKPPTPKPVVVTEPRVFPSRGDVVMNKDRQEYVYIPGGKFLMGCVPESEKECEGNEKPQHQVEISKPFWLGETEVEVEAYRRFARQERHGKMPKAPLWNGSWRTPGFPIVYVSWEDAQAYCGWAGGRLPTEAEWEYAARAGAENQVFPFKEMKESREKANFLGTRGNDTWDDAAPVKQFDPNGFGLYDMSGNVWEWVADPYDPAYYKSSPAVDPPGPGEGRGHVARGGSYASAPEKHLRLSYREHFEKTANHVGFRCLLPDTKETRDGFKPRSQ